MTTLARLSAAFTSRLGTPPTLVVRAPGRVNLIGEHTDYNAGFVMPMAIDRWVWIALRPRADRRVSAASIELSEAVEFDLSSLLRGGRGWGEYLKGTAWALQQAGHHLRGFDAIVSGDLPIGAGLSSSAALELAAARALIAAADLPWDAPEMARLCQTAENQWVGVRCGIMDQMASACGREAHALLIDCRNLQTSPVPLPRDVSVLVLDTSTRRGLVDSAYNQRRAECEEASRLLGVAALREATVSALTRLDDVLLRRARHVVTENARVLQAAVALRVGDATKVGRLLGESHASLRGDFEVSSPALDAMVECAHGAAGCLGARMTGAGFGGCVVALVASAERMEFAAEVERSYSLATGLTAKLYSCQAANGAEIVWSEPPTAAAQCAFTAQGRPAAS